MNNEIKFIECPRDAMQGVKSFIPTALKIEYLKKLLDVHFDILDYGSFVSEKAIPQMKDTHQITKTLEAYKNETKLLSIVANLRGANEAAQYAHVDYLGYPFSVSQTFQLRNTNADIHESFDRVKEIQEICVRANKKLVVYLSMAFGNPYGDQWNADIVIYWAKKMQDLGVQTIALSDTIGVATPESIAYVFNGVSQEIDNMEIGAHFHTLANQWEEKINAAILSGCRRFDGAIKGYGGCPMAKDELTGNMPTENILHYCDQHHWKHNINKEKFYEAIVFAEQLFKTHQ